MPGTIASTSNVYSLHLYPCEHREMILYHRGKDGTMLKRKRKEKPCRVTHCKEWQHSPLDELHITAASDDCSSYKVDFHPDFPSHWGRPGGNFAPAQKFSLTPPAPQGLSEMCLCMSTEGWGEELPVLGILWGARAIFFLALLLGIKVLATGAAGCHCEEKPGLPRAGRSDFQMFPTAPLQGMAGLSSQSCAALGKM